MKRKDYDILKSEISRLLNEIDCSFDPEQNYDQTSDLYIAACNLRYVANTLCNELVL